MYKVARITFIPTLENDRDVVDKIENILSMLYKNGQIIDWIVEKHDGYYVGNVITTDDDSLDSKYYNSYILDEIKNFDVNVEIVSDDAVSTDSCHCNEHSYYILAINPADASSPIICGDCGKEIPLIHIPYLYKEEEHYSILNFQEIYKAVDNLWMNSLSDRFTKRQITDYKSQLNRLGTDICAELERKTNKPVYYLLCNPIGGWYEFEKNNKNLDKCPKCGQYLTKMSNSHVDKVCHACRLAFIAHEDSDNCN